MMHASSALMKKQQWHSNFSAAVVELQQIANEAVTQQNPEFISFALSLTS
jgi:hypothetical protein